MKQNLLLGFVAVTMSFANMSHADFTFRSNLSNACESISGQWSGSGKASNWLLGECIYNGSGKISTLDSTSHFTIDVAADKVSGSFLCPNHTTKLISGVCANGMVTIVTEYGNLAGSFLSDSGDAKGTLSIAPGLSAEVLIQFLRLK
jgi:hypothetical protein